jgi:mannose-6-phosphate isomerase-like protein (cupin superfamily)
MTNATEREPEVSEETHRAAEAAIKHYSYSTPTDFARHKVSVQLGKGELVRGMIQVVKEGGENNLHYHSNVDGFWMVLKGRVKFYGPEDVLIGEFGPQEGLVIPRYARYWFENSSDEQLEILLVQGFAQANLGESGRTNAEPRKSADNSPRLSVEL